MNSSLTSSQKKFRAVVYIRVGSEKQLLSSTRNVEGDQSSKLYTMANQLLETKYDYRNLPKIHGLIMEEYLKKFLGGLGDNL